MKQRLYDLMDWEAIEAIVYSEEDHPQRVLGPQKVKGGILVQVFVPGAVKAKLRLKSTGSQTMQACLQFFCRERQSQNIRSLLPMKMVLKWS